MKNSNITLCGNLILDIVSESRSFVEGGSNTITSKKRTVGAIGNIIKSLQGLGENVDIHVQSLVGNDDNGQYITAWLDELSEKSNFKIVQNIKKSNEYNTSNAHIISNVENNTRTSFVEWGACTKIQNFENSEDWFHLMYADTFHSINLKDLKKITKNSTVSMDLCLHSHDFDKREKILNSLKYVDFLIASDVELLSLANTDKKENAIKKLGKKCLGWCIMHYPEGSISSNGEKVIKLETKLIDKKINVLGAGDMFFSSFFSKINKDDFNEENVKKALKFSHKNTKLYLEKNACFKK